MRLFQVLGDEVISNGAGGWLTGVALVIGAIFAGVGTIVTIRRTGRVEAKADVLATAVGTPNGKGDVATMNLTQLANQEAQLKALAVAADVLNRRLDTTDQRIERIAGIVTQTNEHLVALLIANGTK